MLNEQSDFIQGLRYEIDQEEQEKMAREAIRRELLRIVHKYDSISLKADIVEDLVINNLGLQENKAQVKECIEQILQNESSRYKMDERKEYIIKEDIMLELSKIADPQKRYQESRNRRAREKLQLFVHDVEIYANVLSYKKINITEENLKGMYSEADLEKNKRWIDLAVTKVLRDRNQER